ncbi:hypothetical protein LOD99_669 [Oopsacas minuta]|uniref:Transcriptional adapter 1-like protein n=1 Tax=Oopsacas minuta TaxID=111878 RepID=A0AAV7JZL1_9METZ|nr:hypothetical protein LOD99_669 [Oopsacas minuta]
MAVELWEAKKQLSEVLEGNLPRYLEILKRWCKQKITKDEFDKLTRTLLPEKSFCLHNQFIMAILLKSFTPSTPDESNPFVADGTYANIYNPTIFDTQSTGNLTAENVLELSFCPNDIYLPDIPSIKSRIILHLWEQNLEDSGNRVEELLFFAMEEFLKNICSFLAFKKGRLKRRRNVDFTSKQYKYTIPGSTPNDRTPNYEMPISLMSLRKYTTLPYPDNKITLFDARDILPLYKSVICSHTVFSRNYERLLSQLWHPS